MDNDDRQDGGAVAFDVLHQLAELLANSGEGVVFVESELRRATGALGSDLELLALPEQLVHATPGIARLDRVSAAHEVVDSLEHGLPAAAARARLEAIAVAPPPLGGRARVLEVALFAGGFAPSVVATASEAAAAVLTGVAFAIRPGIVDLAGPVLVVLPALFVVLPGVRLSAGTGELLAGRITSGTGRVVWSFFILAQMVVGVVGAGAGATALTEQEVPPNCPFLIVLMAWIPFRAGHALVFRARSADLGWVLAGVLCTFLLEQAVTGAAGDVSGTLVAGAVFGAFLTESSRMADAGAFSRRTRSLLVRPFGRITERAQPRP